MGHAVGKRIGLARTGAGDHQQRAVLAAALPGAGRGHAEFHRRALGGVEVRQGIGTVLRR